MLYASLDEATVNALTGAAEKISNATSDASGATGFIDQVKNFFVSGAVKNVIPAVITAVVAILVVLILKGILKKSLQKSKIDPGCHRFLITIISAILYFIAILVVAKAFGIDTTPLIAFLSVASLALSLAVQGILGNIVSGIVILSTHPIRKGEYVSVGGVEGSVDSVGLVYTKLLTLDNKVIYVPNNEISTSKITNFSRDGKRRVDFVFTASYDCKPEDVKAALVKACEVPDILEEEGVFVRLSDYKDSNIEYTVRVWTKVETYWDVYFNVIENVKKTYDENGIVFTYPHINVHMDK